VVLDDKGPQHGEAATAKHGNERSGASGLMERVLARDNLLAALKRVERNKGSAGVDGMKVDGMRAFFVVEWPNLREKLLAGTYLPSPVKRVEIPKDDGGTRQLGIPTVVDRFIQQAVLQVLQPLFDPTFSTSSYGYRPGRSAHDAIRAAQKHIEGGRSFAVEVDLERFFDRVNHDVLMGRLAKRIDDKRVLRLIRGFLEAGVMLNGVVLDRYEGTPQGGPLSPFLANFLLDEVDKELERRGHAFVRYADDLTVYVGSKAAGERVLGSLRKSFAKLRLRINEEKTAVSTVTKTKLLGYSFYRRDGRVLPRIADKSRAKLKDKVRKLTTRTRGVSISHVVDELRPLILGWKNYFHLAETPSVFERLDIWIRYRIVALQLKQWRRGPTAFREAKHLGATPEAAAILASHVHRPWWSAVRGTARFALPQRFFDDLGLPRLVTSPQLPNRRMRTRSSGGVAGVRR
jgi:group II intron reverse transcriptase/maturase